MTCSSIHITAEGISQEDGAAGTVMVPREKIRSVTLSHRSRSRHPFLRFFTGFVLIVTGLVFLTAAFLLAEGGVVQMRLQAFSFGVPVIPIVLWSMVGAGFWLVLGVLRGCYTITIRGDGGSRTLCFAEATDIAEILRFLGRAEREFGYPIDTSLTKTMYIRRSPDCRDDPRPS